MRGEATEGRRTRGGAPGANARWRRRLVRATLGLCLAGAVREGVAAAQGSNPPAGRYVGVAAGAPGTVVLNVSNGTLTAFTGSTSRLVCARAAHASAGPYEFRLSSTVNLRGTAFSFTVHATPAHSGSIVIAVNGGRQAGNEVTGTITASLSDFEQPGNSCHAATSFETVPADRSVSEHPANDTFGRGFTGGSVGRFVGHAGFDYASRRVTQFTGAVDIVCPDRSRFPFLLDSAARGLDPISVNQSGVFAISGLAPLAGHGDIVQFSLTGRIAGKRATGTLRAAVAILFPRLKTCSSITGWSASAR